MAANRPKPDVIYHGSPFNVIEPKILKNEKRTMDFGYGFYCTTSSEQARKWAKAKLRKQKLSEGYVNVYRYDPSFEGLNVKNFGLNPTIDWLDFVVANRINPNLEHDFDVIIGPVADDTAFSAIDTYIDENDTSVERKNRLIKELKTYKLKDQILFHTDRALKQLKYIDALKVANIVIKPSEKPIKGKKL